MICKILGLFVSPLTADGKCSFLNREFNAATSDETKKQKLFLNFFLHSWNLDHIFNILKKMMTIIAYVFPKLETAKEVGRQMSKKFRFRRPFNKQHVKRNQVLLKSARQRLYHTYWSLSKNLSGKKPLLVICKMLEPFVYILSANDKYPLANRDNLVQQIQMKLSKKQKMNLSIFFCILEI